MTRTLEQARMQELDTCVRIIDEGRQFQRDQGFIQWTADYPNAGIIREDLRTGKGYVIRVDGVIAGYLCIDFSGEPAYDHIEGAWRWDRPYAVVHRMAFSRAFQGAGLADAAFTLIQSFCLEQGVDYLRVDTDFPNKRMQHILEKIGFVQCGGIQFQGSKLAYDKRVG